MSPLLEAGCAMLGLVLAREALLASGRLAFAKLGPPNLVLDLLLSRKLLFSSSPSARVPRKIHRLADTRNFLRTSGRHSACARHMHLCAIAKQFSVLLTAVMMRTLQNAPSKARYFPVGGGVSNALEKLTSGRNLAD
ncbi:hypothetical protein D3876_08515 [Sphingomonas cavernae]|uniref:Uncharacterized protein n=1 Tax=Sphingomonas cavernae TaxID=2320861 RepID=A0A418WJT5_9SPHN|nr:hypothetical protein D3876_08515 [Sphingomonas cavernae]